MGLTLTVGKTGREGVEITTTVWFFALDLGALEAPSAVPSMVRRDAAGVRRSRRSAGDFWGRPLVWPRDDDSAARDVVYGPESWADAGLLVRGRPGQSTAGGQGCRQARRGWCPRPDRTGDLSLRRRLLYPTELLGRGAGAPSHPVMRRPGAERSARRRRAAHRSKGQDPARRDGGDPTMSAMPTGADPDDAERSRLAEADAGTVPWRSWGPYLSERAWGTVREDYSEGGDAWDYFPHDHARSRVYRWNEDSMAGFCDEEQDWCLSLGPSRRRRRGRGRRRPGTRSRASRGRRRARPACASAPGPTRARRRRPGRTPRRSARRGSRRPQHGHRRPVRQPVVEPVRVVARHAHAAV